MDGLRRVLAAFFGRRDKWYIRNSCVYTRVGHNHEKIKMPDYSEYIIIEKDEMEFHNHYRGDYTFLCDMFWGEKEAIRIIQNQSKIKESKFDNAHSRIIIDKTNYSSGSGSTFFRKENHGWNHCKK